MYVYVEYIALKVYFWGGSLSLLNQYVYAFCQVFKVCNNYFLKCVYMCVGVCVILIFFSWDSDELEDLYCLIGH